MKTIASSRREQIRAMLADLKLPGALEAAAAVLSEADSGTLTASEAIQKLLGAQISLCATTGACRRPCAPLACRR